MANAGVFWLRALVPLVATTGLGCATVRQADYRVSTLVHAHVTETPTGAFEPQAEFRQAGGTDGASISGQATRSRPCFVTTNSTYVDSIEHVRTVKAPRAVWTAALVGTAGAAFFTWGLTSHLDGAPLLTERDAQNSRSFTTEGYAVYLGGIASLLLIPAVYTVFASIDSTEVEERTTTTVSDGRCQKRAAGGVVARLTRGDIVVSTQTDAGGYFKLQVPPGEAASASVSIDGKDVGTIALAPRADATASPVPSPPSSSLTLFGVALKGAARDALEAAIIRAGGLKLESDRRAIALFDAKNLGLPGMTRIKVMFDGASTFVQAKYEGRVSAELEADLLRLLRERYGEPLTKDEAGAVSRSWSFDDGLRLEYVASQKPGATVPASLLFVDPVAAERLRLELAVPKR